jgi:hypothetical protein
MLIVVPFEKIRIAARNSPIILELECTDQKVLEMARTLKEQGIAACGIIAP